MVGRSLEAEEVFLVFGSYHVANACVLYESYGSRRSLTEKVMHGLREKRDVGMRFPWRRKCMAALLDTLLLLERSLRRQNEAEK